MDNNNQIEEIKNRLDIAQVVEKYVKLKQTGKNYSGLCPFHNEKTPSFIVSPDIQRYKCFGCGETGDIFNFIQKIENIDFPEALERLAKQAGVELKKRQVNYKYKTLEEINYKATKYFYNELKNNKTALQYLHDRGFTNESIKNFGVGYAPKKPGLRQYLLKTSKYSRNELLNSGLFSLKNNNIKEKFYDRIMFPIRSNKGAVIAFTGRILPGNNWGPKYMNSPETPIFHKKNNVFGQYESRQEIRKVDLAILCEGSTDVISAHQHGINNIVAPLGTGLTTEQLSNLSKMTKNLLFFFDSDEAGENALIRAFKLASELQLNPYATNAKPYKDIDELLKEDPQKMISLVKNKKEAFSFILTNYMEDKDVNKLEDLNKIRDFIGSLLSSVKDETTKKHYTKKALDMTKIDIYTKQYSSYTSKKHLEKPTTVLVKETDNILEKKYIKLLLILEKIENQYLVPIRYISSESLLAIYREIKDNKSLSKEKLYAKLKNSSKTEDIFENLIFDLADIPSTHKEIMEELKAVMRLLKKTFLKNRQKDLSIKIAIAEENGNNKESEKYLKELIDINKILQETENG